MPSSTLSIPQGSQVPRHLAIIMDGNGRWATKRYLPRTAGHARGVQTVRRVLQACGEAGARYLTFCAFRSEKWRRPQDEAPRLRRLFVETLDNAGDKRGDGGGRVR